MTQEPAVEGAPGQPESQSEGQNGGHSEAPPASKQKHTQDEMEVDETVEGQPAKRVKIQDESSAAVSQNGEKKREKISGVAMIKAEYLITTTATDDRDVVEVDDDAAEGRTAGADGSSQPQRDNRGRKGKKDRDNKAKGQNRDRDFGRSEDALRLCSSVATSPEFSPRPCRFGDRCNNLHDLRRYLREGRRADLETFAGKCPVFEAHGRCPSGWKCRFVGSHMREVEHPDGRKELVLVEEDRSGEGKKEEGEAGEAGETEEAAGDDGWRPGVVNVMSVEDRYNLSRRKIKLEKSEAYIKWLDREMGIIKKHMNDSQRSNKSRKGEGGGEEEEQGEEEKGEQQDHRAQFVDPPLRPSEKRRIYFGAETPVLAPLTTQGNLPFRRLCVELGAQGTYSEMAMGMDLVTGKASEWALMKAHVSETLPPLFRPSSPGTSFVQEGYDHARDLKFGAQIEASQPWVATKAAEALARFAPHLRLIDVNCGCPIDLVYKQGGGSALLDAPNKLERMVRGMNTVSGEVPITAKLRIGVREGHAGTAKRNIERLAFGGPESRDRPGLGAPGCAAITLHGRTRQQRYRKPADWGYIAECAALVRSYRERADALADTAREPDPSDLANTPASRAGAMYFLGNGDCYSHEHYRDHLANAGVDAVMIGRGALVKPWLFEEISAGQYLDKSAAERLAYVERFCRFGMDAWGTDERGLGTTRRFLLEWLGFASRYVPIGLLEYLPPGLADRPPAFRCRNELETLLASRNYKDWIKISEMFLGPAHPDFKFEPKHKSSAYEGEG